VSDPYRVGQKDFSFFKFGFDLPFVTNRILSMSLDAARGRVNDAQDNWDLRWENVIQYWNDPVQREFSEKYVEPLDQLTHDWFFGLDRLRQLFTQIRQECSNEERL
jgi:hypothetical protein